jgi:hypothetical protein
MAILFNVQLTFPSKNKIVPDLSELDCTNLLLEIQGVSEIRVLILTSGGTRSFMKLCSITFCKIRKFFKIFCPLIFTKRVVLCD